MNKLLEIRKLSHQAQDTSDRIWIMWFSGNEKAKRIFKKSLHRASRRMDKWEAMMKK